MTLKEWLGVWALPSIIIFLILIVLFIVGYDIVKETTEDIKHIEEHGVSQPELKCKTFCDPLPYYFDTGGLFANDICECKYGVDKI